MVLLYSAALRPHTICIHLTSGLIVRLARALLFLSFLLAHSGFSALAQVPATIGEQFTTEEHLAKPGWWPRKGNALRTDYVGAQVCAQCHSALARGQQRHAMAHTAIPAAQAQLPS